jgi:hypothetical protein
MSQHCEGPQPPVALYDWEMAAAANAAGAFKAKQSDGGGPEDGQHRMSRGSGIAGLGKLVGKALEGGLAKIAQTALQVGAAGLRMWGAAGWCVHLPA